MQTQSTASFSPEQMLDRFALGGIEHIRTSFKAHLLGTYELLVEWGHSRTLSLAGLLHSVYGTKTFAPSVLDGVHDRATVAAIIGTEAEELAYIFCASDRKRLLLENSSSPYYWVDHKSGERHPLTVDTLRALVELEAANFLEQCDRVDNEGIQLDMQARFAAAAAMLSAPAKRAVHSRLSG